MNIQYAILGAGMQGTAAAFDLARHGEASEIRIGDLSAEQAQRSASRVNQLAQSGLCTAAAVNALDPDSLREFLKGAHVLLSCVPYWMHPRIARVAIECGVHMCDLGGNTDVTLETLDLSPLAVERGVGLVPDCGLAPGLVNSLGMYLVETVPGIHSVKLYCGVLPQNPVPPLNYKVTFNVEGLVTEYDYEAVALRDREIVKIPTLTEHEELEVAPVGTMEAFVTSGGTSTAPYTLKSKLRNYEYKTLRFPGHCAQMKLFKDFGLWSEEPIEVPGGSVRPKDVFCKVFGPKLAAYVDADQCFVRAIGVGDTTKTLDIHDKECSETGFTSMERLTGFSLATIAHALATGRIPSGVNRYEEALSGTEFVSEIRKRGIVIHES